MNETKPHEPNNCDPLGSRFREKQPVVESEKPRTLLMLLMRSAFPTMSSNAPLDAA